MSENDKTEMWAVVEIMGHKRIAGKVSEEVKFGVPMMRVDVPETKTHKPFVRYFGGSSIHSFTPMDETDVRRAAEWLDESPSVLPGVIQSPQLAEKIRQIFGAPDDYGFGGSDDDGGDYDDDPEHDDDPDDDDENEAIVPAPVTIVNDETWQIVRDETKNSKSPMWRCSDHYDRKFNVFKHADADKDTFHLFAEAGYGDAMLAMKVGDVLSWRKHPIRVDLLKIDGWWNVISVYPRPEGSKPDEEDPHLDEKEKASSWAKKFLGAGDYVFLDTETTGRNTERADQPVSIAVIDSNGNVLLDTLVKPTIEIEAEATAIHGIDAEKLKDAPTFDEVRPKLIEVLRYKRVITYNAEFDEEIILNAHRPGQSNSLAWDLPRPWICAMKEYAAFYGEWNSKRQNFKWQSLEKACEQQEIADIDTPAHSALGDCLRTLALIKKMAAYDPHPF